ncbi:MAG: Rrf2 family transcriptional regulator [Lentisphaeria bacterium]|nr:Rrf2 family transcriptional regulator [Lentisphaeria bacterium]
MQLTLNADYSYRVLMYLADRPGELIQTKEISEFFEISKNHLTKVVNTLGHLDYIEVRRGRYGGGIKLNKKPEEIKLGDFLASVEPTMDIVGCFDSKDAGCLISRKCSLKRVFYSARQAFLDELNTYTLVDLIGSTPTINASK